MNSMFFSGETEARAVLAAANHFGVSPEQVVFDRVEKRHGFVKHRRVVIRVDPASVGRSVDGGAVEGDGRVESDNRVESGNRVESDGGGGVESRSRVESDGRVDLAAEPAVEATVPAVAAPAPAESAAAAVEPEAPEQSSEEVLSIAHTALDQLLELADLEVSAEMVLTDERLEVEIEGVDEELLVEDEGQVLLALQHLLPRVMYGRLGRIIPCRLDSGGYQRKKEERLRGLARRVAEEVVRRGGTRTLRPMNPADRRIVHLTLADDPDVETESQGNGYFKRVSIRLH